MSRKPGSIHALRHYFKLFIRFQHVFGSGVSSRVSPQRHSRPCRGLWLPLARVAVICCRWVQERKGTGMEAMEGDTTRSAIEACGRSANAGGKGVRWMWHRRQRKQEVRHLETERRRTVGWPPRSFALGHSFSKGQGGCGISRGRRVRGRRQFLEVCRCAKEGLGQRPTEPTTRLQMEGRRQLALM